MECPRVHKDGTRHDPKNIVKEPVLDRNGKVASYVVYCREPTPEEEVFKKCMYHFPEEKK